MDRALTEKEVHMRKDHHVVLGKMQIRFQCMSAYFYGSFESLDRVFRILDLMSSMRYHLRQGPTITV